MKRGASSSIETALIEILGRIHQRKWRTMRKFMSEREFQNKTRFPPPNWDFHHHAIIHVVLNESLVNSSNMTNCGVNGGDRTHRGWRPPADRSTIPYRLSGVDLLPDIGRIPFRPVPKTNPDTDVIYKGSSASSNGICSAELPSFIGYAIEHFTLGYLSTIAMCSPLVYSQPNKWYSDTPSRNAVRKYPRR